MKKVILLTAASLCIAAISNAQITKGSKLLGLDFGAGYNKSGEGLNESKQSHFNFNPSLGFAIKENSVLGFRVNYGHGKMTTGGISPERKTTEYGAGVFLRRYLQLGKKVYLFGEGAADYNYSYSKDANNGYKYTSQSNSITLSAYPGLSYTATKRLMIDAGLNRLVAIGYSNSKSTQTTPNSTSVSKNSSFGLSTTLGGNTSFSVGFRFLLP